MGSSRTRAQTCVPRIGKQILNHCATREVPCFTFFFFCNKFTYWLCWVFLAGRGLSLAAVRGDHSLLQCMDLSLRWSLSLWSTGSRHEGFSSCGMRAQQLWLTDSRAQAQYLWLMGSAAPWHVASSQTRARTHVPCIGRRTPNHWATREDPLLYFLFHILWRSVNVIKC